MSTLEPHWVLAGVIALWHELPDLFATEWRNAHPKLLALAKEITSATEELELSRSTIRMAEVFSISPKARERLVSVIKRGAERIDPTMPPGLPPTLEEVQAGLRTCLAPPDSVRYPDILLVDRLALGARATIRIALEIRGRPDALPAQPLSLRPKTEVQVRISVPFGGLEIEGEEQASLLFEGEEPSTAAHFVVRATQPGRTLIWMGFWQRGSFVGSVAHEIEVSSDSQIEPKDPHRYKAEILPLGEDRPVTDLEIVAERLGDPGAERIFVTLTSGNRCVSGLDSLKLPIQDAASAEKEVLNRLRKLEQESDKSLSERDLEALGHYLYSRYLGAEFHAHFIRFSQYVESIRIISDIPWLPWELVKPNMPGESKEYPFLCHKFNITRWLKGVPLPPQEIRVDRLAFVASLPPNHSIETERSAIDSLVRLGASDRSPIQANRREMLRLLEEEDLDFLFVATHGYSPREDADQSYLEFEDGGSISPVDLDARRLNRMIARRSFVFLNACQGAVIRSSGAGEGGWPDAFVRRGGCGAFIAPLLKVGDRRAGIFASELIGALVQGQTLAQAVRTARDSLRAQDPNNPAWLAYVLYGGGETRITLPLASAAAKRESTPELPPPPA